MHDVESGGAFRDGACRDIKGLGLEPCALVSVGGGDIQGDAFCGTQELK